MTREEILIFVRKHLPIQCVVCKKITFRKNVIFEFHHIANRELPLCQPCHDELFKPFTKMTRAEILNMPAGREMRDLIATEVMKWEWDDGGRGFRSGWDKPDGSWVDFDDWRPDEDIFAAWEVVVKLKALGFEAWLMNEQVYKDFPGQVYACKLYGNGKVYFCLGETMPLAISRAALLAVMDTGGK